MKRIPKTPIEFDYDLWTTEDGKCMVRVKCTGEVTEVDREVMKALRAEEKRLRRSYTGSNSDDTEEAEDKSSTLSLDALPEDDVKASAWLADPRDFTEEVTTAMLEQDFLRILTDTQRDIFTKVLREGMKPYDYAKAKDQLLQHGHNNGGLPGTLSERTLIMNKLNLFARIYGRTSEFVI